MSDDFGARGCPLCYSGERHEHTPPTIPEQPGMLRDLALTVIGQKKLPWWRRALAWLAPSPEEPEPELTVQEFFRSVKNSVEELAIVDEREKGYELAVQRAREGGQTALVEQLERVIIVVRAETQLVASGAIKYLDEHTVVEFVKKSPKGLRLDWTQNFTRVIPADVLEKKKAADARGIFDNYAVLHYDPKSKSWAETQAQINRKRDPILFGLIEGRRRLYYVGDWIDEFCDLTLDQIADAMGKEAVKELPRGFEP